MTGYKKKYGRDYSSFDKSKFDDYQLLVRIKSDETYKRLETYFTKDGDLSRGKKEYHLDHIVPIKACFDNGINIDTASSKENLELIPYLVNLKKSWSKYSDESLSVLLVIDKKPKTKNVYRQISADFTFTLLKYGVRSKQQKMQFIEFDESPIKLKILKDDESQTDISKNTFYIREYEFRNKREIVESRVLQLIGKSTRIFARNCYVSEISTQLYSTVCSAHHIQDSAGAKIKLGLFEKRSNELVSILSFSKPRFSDKYDFELLRFCNKVDHSVVGGASKLFSHFKRMNPGVKIVSYADKRWSRGNLYHKLGFTLVNETSKSFYYFRDGVIISRYQAQKHRLKELLETFDCNKTGVENMEISGYTKVLNPGQYVFEYQNLPQV